MINQYKILIDSKKENLDFFENAEDFNFFKSKNLLIEKHGGFFVNFVGEIKTPNAEYFSFPKNFKKENFDKNIILFRTILNKFKDSKKDNTVIVHNKTFIPKLNETFDSDEYYYNELKKCFLDFVAYEFIYPLKTVTVHSATPVKGGKLDILKSVENRKRFGTGMTYKTKDVSDNPDWKLDKIYYDTLFVLAKKYGTQSERDEIEQMKDDLNNEGYNIKDPEEKHIKELEKHEEVLKSIYKSDVNPVHYHIKDSLIEYYSKLKLGESSFKINIIYTKTFSSVWEDLMEKTFFHNKSFENRMKNKFTDVQTLTKWVSPDKQDDFISKLGDRKVTTSENNPNFLTWEEGELEPDIFSEFERENFIYRFIGDAKYYKNIDSDFRKELHEYNTAMDNEYPMCIFVCGDETNFYRKKKFREKEILIFQISPEEALQSAIDSDIKFLHNILNLIFKYTDRKESFKTPKI